MGATNSVNSQERQNRAILKANQNIQDMITNNPEFMDKAMKQGLEMHKQFTDSNPAAMDEMMKMSQQMMQQMSQTGGQNLQAQQMLQLLIYASIYIGR